jgi:hypothetical protein
MTMPSPNATDPSARARFCEYLRSKRTAAALSIEEIAHVTRIPERSLHRLEAGTFEELPGDIFVRGFVRSYAQCVGLDPEDAIRRYAALGLTPAPVASKEAERVSAARSDFDDDPNVRVPRRLHTSPVASSEAPRGSDAGEAADSDSSGNGSGAVESAAASAEANQQGPARPPFVLPPSLFESDEPRRGHLTLAVIILAIVATLTMSYLMRRPSDPGEGVTWSVQRPELRRV